MSIFDGNFLLIFNFWRNFLLFFTFWREFSFDFQFWREFSVEFQFLTGIFCWFSIFWREFSVNLSVTKRQKLKCKQKSSTLIGSLNLPRFSSTQSTQLSAAYNLPSNSVLKKGLKGWKDPINRFFVLIKTVFTILLKSPKTFEDLLRWAQQNGGRRGHWKAIRKYVIAIDEESMMTS